MPLSHSKINHPVHNKSGNHSMARLRLRIEKRVRCYKVFRFRLFSERQFNLMNNAIPTFLSLHSFLYGMNDQTIFDRGKTAYIIYRKELKRFPTQPTLMFSFHISFPKRNRFFSLPSLSSSYLIRKESDQSYTLYIHILYISLSPFLIIYITYHPYIYTSVPIP